MGAVLIGRRSIGGCVLSWCPRRRQWLDPVHEVGRQRERADVTGFHPMGRSLSRLLPDNSLDYFGLTILMFSL